MTASDDYESRRFTELEDRLGEIVKEMSHYYQSKPPPMEADGGFRVALESLKRERLQILREMGPIAPPHVVPNIIQAIAEAEVDVARGEELLKQQRQGWIIG